MMRHKPMKINAEKSRKGAAGRSDSSPVRIPGIRPPKKATAMTARILRHSIGSKTQRAQRMASSTTANETPTPSKTRVAVDPGV